MDNNKIREAIIKILKDDRRPMPSGILMEKVKSITHIDNKKKIYDYIDLMIKNKELIKNSDGKLVESYINSNVLEPAYKGVIALNSQLDGYVKIYDENNEPTDKEAYVNNINLCGAVSGDLVEIKYLEDKFTKANVQHAIVTKVIEHNTKFVVGTFELIGNTYNVVLDDTRNYLKIKLNDVSNLVNGSKILIELKQHTDQNTAIGDVVKVLGHKDDVGIDILSIIVANQIEQDFSKESLDIAESYKIDPNDNKEVRKDISDRTIITIDPATSKDLDDAIFVKKLENGNYFLSVSIADVSNYVKYGSALWNEAMQRSTSVYLVDRVIPMLPHTLSNNICSLNPEEYRLTLTCDIEIDKTGNYKNIDVFPSLIRSIKRFSYDEVNEYFETKNKAIAHGLDEMLDLANELHNILRSKKQKEGYIDFEIKEPKIIVDEKCWPIDIQLRERGEAQKMIEDFMVAANEAVTIKAEELRIPFIYRVHKKPDISKLENFAVEARKLGFITNHADFENMEPATIARWLENNKDNPNISLISKLLLRCMQKAEYSTHNHGHFGLSSNYYTHFTSPIRRSPDTIVHTLYWMFVFTPEKFTNEQKEMIKKELDNYCTNATAKEIIAVSTEREVNQLKFCQYMSQHVGEVYDGVISTIRPFGIFVELPNTIEVLVRINNIGGDFWKYNQENNTIEGMKSHKVFTFGQKIKVKILDVNIANKQISAIIVGHEPTFEKSPRRQNSSRKINVNSIHKKY